MFNVLILFPTILICLIFLIFRFKNIVYSSIKSDNQSPNLQQFGNLPVRKIFLDGSQLEISKQWIETIWGVSNYLSFNSHLTRYL